MKKNAVKNQMRYIFMVVVAFVLFMSASILLENNVVTISASALLAIVGTVGMFYAGMKLDFFIFDEGSLLAVINQWVNKERTEVVRRPRTVTSAAASKSARPVCTAEIIAYQQKRNQQHRFEEIAYTIKAVS